MPWTREGPLRDAHREQLLASGVDPDVLADLDLRLVTGPLPSWWGEQRNALYLPTDVDVPHPLIDRLSLYPFSDALLVAADDLHNLSSLLLGDRATVFLGPETELTAGDVYCGPDSTVVLNGGVTATRCAIIDARNGGAVVADRDQLWAADVYVATDDMHGLVDLETGVRLNPFGGRVQIGAHVWLGRDAVITGDVVIGDGAVVGLRSLVRGQKVPANAAVAGTPARVIREGVTWREDDVP